MFPFLRRRRAIGYGFPVRRPLLRRIRLARFFNRFGVFALALVPMLVLASPTLASAKTLPGGGSIHVVKKDDVTPALDCFSQAVFGRTYTYTDTGAIAASLKANIYLPQNDQDILNLKIKDAGLAAYGTISNGLEVVLAGERGVVINDEQAAIAVGGLAEIALGGYSAPADQTAALALVSEVAPALSDLNWTTVTTQHGNYIFYAYGTRTYTTGHGPVEAAVGAKATVYTGPEGNTVVSVLVGTGGLASLVK